MRISKFLTRLSGVSSSGNAWMARCPAHDDREPSLSVTAKNGRILFYCHAGCTWKEIRRALKRLGVTKRDLVASSKEIVAAESARSGITLKHYAQAKRLRVKFLKKLGIMTAKNFKPRRIVMPYCDEHGELVSIRYRLTLAKSGDVDRRFQWRKGDKPLPYGLSRLDLARKAGYIVIAEGESDSQTMWAHGIPAIGIPGATSWKAEWADFFEGIPKILVVIEPDAGGEAVLKWLSTSKIRERVHLVSLGEYKDPSELHIADRKKFTRRWAKACRQAVPWARHTELVARHRAKESWRTCKQLARQPRILDCLVDSLKARGVVGEAKTVKRIYLMTTTRLTAHPVSVVIKGPSSGGKSYLAKSVLEFFPSSAFYDLTGMSDKAIVYSEEPLVHRVLVIYEADGMKGDFAEYGVRSLLSEGCVRYETVEKRGGTLKPRLIERQGPTGLLITTTRNALHPENETRMLSLTVKDTPEQTRRILKAQARVELNGDGTQADLRQWHALQEYLATTRGEVKIPWLETLADLIPPAAVRLRRDFPTITSLIKGCALLHQAHRKKTKTGVIIPAIDDYAIVADLFGDLVAQGVEASVPKTVRQTVRAVRKLMAQGRSTAIVDVARVLKLDKGTVSRRVAAAIECGYLRNEEEREGHAAILRRGDRLPEEMSILPSVKALKRRWKREKQETKKAKNNKDDGWKQMDRADSRGRRDF